jgi:mercuric reductase
VGLVEFDTLGGTCLNRGCIPSKTLIEGAYLSNIAKSRIFPGIYINSTSYFHEVSYGCKNEIKVNNETFSTEKFLIATGARPLVPNIPGIENVEYLTSRSALSLSELPESIVFVGSGFIGLELGQFFRRMGSTVILIERSGRILKDYEPEIAETLMDIFEAEGIKIFNNTTLRSIENIDRKVLIKLEVNGKSEEIFTEKIVFAIGRVPNIKDIGLEEIEVEVDKNGFIKSMKRTEQTFQAYEQ